MILNDEEIKEIKKTTSDGWPHIIKDILDTLDAKDEAFKIMDEGHMSRIAGLKKKVGIQNKRIQQLMAGLHEIENMLAGKEPEEFMDKVFEIANKALGKVEE